MSGPVVADRRRELGRRQRAVVGRPDGPDRTSRAGMVVVRVAVQSLGYLSAEIPRIVVQSAALEAEPRSSHGLW
jgi:hypothetical protein